MFYSVDESSATFRQRTGFSENSPSLIGKPSNASEGASDERDRETPESRRRRKTDAISDVGHDWKPTISVDYAARRSNDAINPPT